MPTAKMMDKGLVVIPKEIREKLGLKKGDRVRITERDRQIIVTPVSRDPIAEGWGILKDDSWTMEDYLREKQEELEEEERGLPPPPPRP